MSKLEKLTDAEVLRISNRMFYGGFLFLPWLWLVHALYVYPTLASHPAIAPTIKTRIILSVVGAAVALALLVAWIAVYVAQRPGWGTRGDALSVVIPYG